MVKCILIDDENLALDRLERLLSVYEDLEILRKYTDVLHALDEVEILKPDVIFLDINMPRMSGVVAAEKFQGLLPDSEIIFITAYSEYAVEAFELEALDYVVKPIDKKRLKKTVERIRKMMDERVISEEESQQKLQGHNDRRMPSLQIRCFGRFEVIFHGLEPIKWRTEKTRELMAYLINHRSSVLTKEQIINDLWPNDSPEKAMKLLYNGIYYIRKALKDNHVDKTLILVSGDYKLTLGNVHVDMDRMLELMNGPMEKQAFEEIIQLYKAPYLYHDNWEWSVEYMGYLDRRYDEWLEKALEKWWEDGLYDDLEPLLEMRYAQVPLESYITYYLLLLYKENGKKKRAIEHYTRYADMLKAEMGLEPEAAIKLVIKNL